MGGARILCLDCRLLEGKLTNSVDFCDDPECYSVVLTTTMRDDLEKSHVPEHNIVKLRTVLQYGECPALHRKAKSGLDVCKQRFPKNRVGPSAQVAVDTSGLDGDTPIDRRANEGPSSSMTSRLTSQTVS